MPNDTNLDAMLNAIIDNNPDAAQVNFHTYLKSKIQDQLGNTTQTIPGGQQQNNNEE